MSRTSGPLGYAVIDLETTGVRPGWRDRVVEVAVVQLDPAGNPEREWSTLLNPERDLGPQHVHGIRAADVLDAPVFKEVAGTVRDLLAGRVVVAHNLRFDVDFLRSEYERLGVTVPLDPADGLCTMRLASRYLPGAARSLRDCCARAGVRVGRHHEALDDARAAAGLLRYYLDRAGAPPPWQDHLEAAARAPWPRLPVTPVRPVHRRASGKRPGHFLAHLVDRLPRASSEAEDAYLDLLDRALLDRHLSVLEAQSLRECAETVGLGRTQVVELHRSYLRSLVAQARAEGTLTPPEREELADVAEQLGLTRADLERALTADVAPGAARPGFVLAPRDEVVFTGQFDGAREEWEELARQAGLTVGGTVTKRRTRLLVAADPDTTSRKAALARRYGIPVVDVTTLRRLIAQMPAAGRRP